jgi:spermidine synthase
VGVNSGFSSERLPPVCRSEESRFLPASPAVTFFLFFTFFLSGANGLVYEIVFRRQLLLSLGVTHYSIGTVLTVFMAGLGIGSAIFGRVSDRARNPLLLFGVLEAGTGILGLVLVRFLPSLDGFYAGLVRSLGAGDHPNVALKAAIAGCCLLPPTVLMGGTLPLLGKSLVRENRPPGETLGLLYGVNTLGGVAGSVGVTFFLLGVLGARRSLVAVSALGISLGLTVAIIAARGGRERREAVLRGKRGGRNRNHGDRTYGERRIRRFRLRHPGGALLHENGASAPRYRGALALTAIFATGFVGLSLEVYWARILAYVIGSHGYAFGVILASFLTGIASGSLILSRFFGGTQGPPLKTRDPLIRIRDPIRLLGVFLVVLGVSVIAVSFTLYRLRHLVDWLNAAAAGSWSRFITLEAGAVFSVLLVPTLLLGAAYPLVLSIVSGGAERLGSSVGRVAAVNTFGSILGSFTSGFLLIPLLGIAHGLRTLVGISAALGFFILARSGRHAAGTTVPSTGGEPAGKKARFFTALKSSGSRFLAPFVGAAAIAVLVAVPAYVRLSPALQTLGDDERLLFYDEASPATVAVRENGSGERMLAINGLDEVPVDVSSLLTFRVLGHLPLLLHPHPEEVMVLSLGGAVTTGSVSTHDVKSIDAVELCRPVVKAATFFEAWNHGVLRDRRLRIIIQDGRNHLLTTSKRYDVITADATHPWSADSWILYTREFYELVRLRLSKGGLFCQWVPLHWLSPEDYRCILRTIRTVFPEVSLWYTGSYTVALAGNERLYLDPGKIAERMRRAGVREDLESAGIDSAASLLGLFLMSGEGIERFTRTVAVDTGAARKLGRIRPDFLIPDLRSPLNTDDLAYLEHSAFRCYGRETTPENLAALIRFRQSPRDVWANAGTVARMDEFLNARGKLMQGRIATYDGNFERAIRFYEYALTIAPGDRLSEMFLEDAKRTLAAYKAALGDRLRKEGSAEDALGAYTDALAVDPGEPSAHHGIGLLLLSGGEYGAALGHFDRALERRGRDPEIRAGRAAALAALGLKAEAEMERREILLLKKGMPREKTR